MHLALLPTPTPALCVRRALAEEVVRERMAKQEACERLKELREQMPDADVHKQIYEARDACAGARGEAAALQVLLGYY
jgi:hypothetical protein